MIFAWMTSEQEYFYLLHINMCTCRVISVRWLFVNNSELTNNMYMYIAIYALVLNYCTCIGKQTTDFMV